jgi:membrane protein YdfJ
MEGSFNMANFFYRLGGWAYREKKSVFIGTFVLLFLVVGIGIKKGPSFTGEMSIPGTKAEQALHVVNTAFHTNSTAEGGTIQFIFKAPEGQTLETATTKKIIQDTLESIRKDQEVAAVANPFETGTMSQNKEIGLAVVTYKASATEVTSESKELVMKAAEQARENGLQTELSGSVALTNMEIGGISEVIGVLIAFMILAITFGSFLAAGLPILTAIIALALGMMGIFISSHFFDMASFSLSVAVMLGLAVGIDYGLFIISRFRQNLLEGREIEESVALANATAGSAVVFAGLTVIIALVGLSVTGIPFITTMGISAAFAVFLAVIVSLLIVPAILGLVGEKIRPKGKANSQNEKVGNNAYTSHWGGMVTKYPLPLAIAGILLLGAIALPALHLQTGLPDNGLKSTETTERRGYDLLSKAFGKGYNGPLVVVAKAALTENAQIAIANATNELSSLPNVASVTPPYMSPSGDIAILTLLPKTGPHDIETSELVKAIRNSSEELEQKYQVELMVTGSTAVNIDLSENLNKALPQFAVLIVGLALILLTMVFRSIIVPIKAVLGYMLTLAATLGFVVFVVQDGNMISMFGIPVAGPVLSFLPILVAGILFGLAMDYEVFLVSRIREDFIHKGDPTKAVQFGIKNSGGVVTAAGLIMVVVFGSFIFAEDTMLKSMGLALSFGVLVDAFIVRLTIVPAVMTLLGRSAWYVPKWLNRIMPNIDVEGEKFMKEDGTTNIQKKDCN